MKFVVDANLPYSTKELLEQFGQTWHARDVGLESAPDETIIKFSTAQKAVLITRDLGFGNPFLFPKGSHGGVVIIRIPNQFTMVQIHRLLQTFFSSIDLESLEGAVTVVEPGRFRIRR